MVGTSRSWFPTSCSRRTCDGRWRRQSAERRRRAAETQPAPAVTRRRGPTADPGDHPAPRRRSSARRRAATSPNPSARGEDKARGSPLGRSRICSATPPLVVRRSDPAPGRASPRCEPRSRRIFESARCGSSCRATSRTRRTRRRRPRCPRPTSDPLGASCGTGTPSPPSTPCPPGTCPGTRPRRTAGPRPISSPVTSPAAPWIRGSRPTGSPPTAPWVYPPPGARRARSLITRSFTSATTRARRRTFTPACPPANRPAKSRRATGPSPSGRWSSSARITAKITSGRVRCPAASSRCCATPSTASTTTWR
mmetsp:Transcript_7383/g.32589  ORF Transcript_7383/g.32589 Transcript_7383/m.32589 type:complete len:310 (+) Transcript_7383:1455-2384(+)